MPALVGGYRLLTRLRTGGMAEVYLAETRRGARVAIKRLLPHLDGDPRFATALRDEALIGARLVHPNIVRVLDYADEQGRGHLVMELVEGITLGQLRASRPPLALAAALIAQAAAAVDHAHGRCIVHGDLTPSNLLVSTAEAPRAWKLKLCDFGLARDLRAPIARPPSGNPAYLAPEQAGGLPGDEKSDIYALAVCAWELTSARRLHPRTDERQGASASLARVRAAGLPPLDALRAAPRLKSIVGAALATDPSRRLPTARALGDAFLDWLVENAQQSEEVDRWQRQLTGAPAVASAPVEITVTAVG